MALLCQLHEPTETTRMRLRTILYLLLTISLCCCSSRRHLADGEMTAHTHDSDTTRTVIAETAESAHAVSGTLLSSSEDERAALDSAITETVIAWGICPDGVVRPETIRTVSIRFLRGWERMTFDLDVDALFRDTVTTAVDTTHVTTHDAVERVEYAAQEQQHGQRLRMFVLACIVDLLLISAGVLIYITRKR